jgi:uncharacterized protein YbbK (DUF523 family)
MIIVSACLAGFCCAYDGKDRVESKIIELIKEGKAIPVCPEQLGGLTTPREPVEIVNGKVMTKEGRDVTHNFQRGAEEVLNFAKNIGATSAILKSRSPSCGFGTIYDGSFTGTKTPGNGFTAQLLSENNIKILTSDDL